MTWDDDYALTVIPTVPDNPYGDGLAALLYAHGAVAEAAAMDRKLKAAGGKVPEGGFPSRCTNIDDEGRRCFLEYAHRGDCSFTLSGWNPPKHQRYDLNGFADMAEKQPPARVIDENKAVEFLRNKVRENTRKHRELNEALNANAQQKKELDAEERRLYEEQLHLKEAIATLKGVIKGRRGEGGEGHGGSR